MIYSVDDLNMAMLDPYNTASNISLMRQHMGYGHIFDLNKLTQKVLLNTQYLSAMNPTAGSFIVNPRLQRLFATFAIGFPSLDALNTIYATFLVGHLSKFGEEVQECGKRLVQAALQQKGKKASVSVRELGEDRVDPTAVLKGLKGVGSKASEKEIRLAYKKSALECHPDRFADATADERARCNPMVRVPTVATMSTPTRPMPASRQRSSLRCQTQNGEALWQDSLRRLRFPPV